MDEWMVMVVNKAAGPYSADQIRAMIRAGKIRQETSICRKGDNVWAAASSFGVFVNDFVSKIMQKDAPAESILNVPKNPVKPPQPPAKAAPKDPAAFSVKPPVPAAEKMVRKGDEISFGCPFCHQHYSVPAPLRRHFHVVCSVCKGKFNVDPNYLQE